MVETSSPDAAILGLAGWVADRTPGCMAGARALAERCGQAFARPVTLIGSPEPPADPPWDKALDRARPQLRRIADRMTAAMGRHQTPIVFANRCAASMATLPPVLAAHPEACVVWLDAHGDLNTPAGSSTGYLGGMPLGSVCGLWDSGFGNGLPPGRLVLVGTRDLDPAEREIVAREAISIIPPHNDGEIDAEAVWRATEDRPTWIHIDLDVLEPGHIPTEYQVAGGLTPDAVRHLLALLVQYDRILGLEVAEFDLHADRFAGDAETILSMIDPVTRAVLGTEGA